MSNQRPLEHMFGLMLAVLITAGCGGRQAEPTVTSTPIPPTLTPVPATSTPVPLTPTPVPPTPTPRVTIFTIGMEDKDYREFTARGFREVREYTCRVGVDCSTETFPDILCRDLVGDGYADEEVN